MGVPGSGADVPWPSSPCPAPKEVGAEAVKVLAGCPGCLLANHGVLTVGATLERARIRAVYVEDAAKICSIAMSHGPIVTMGEEYIAAMKK